MPVPQLDSVQDYLSWPQSAFGFYSLRHSALDHHPLLEFKQQKCAPVKHISQEHR